MRIRRMTAIVLAVFMLMAWLPLTHAEAKEEVIAGGLWDGGPVTWEITADGTLTIDGQGNHIRGATQYIWKDYSDVVTKIVIGKGIKGIPKNAFSGMKNVTSVQLGSNVIKIEEAAFSECDGLTEISLPAKLATLGEKAFYGCESLVAVNFPADIQLTIIPEYAFYGTGLTNLMTPAGVTTIEAYAFAECKSLKSVHLHEGLQSLKAHAFKNCSQLADLYIPSTMETLNNSFSGCDALENLEIYCSGLVAGFSDKTNLKTVVVGGNVSAIHSSCFQGCTSLSEVVIADSVKKIDDHAFYGCTSLGSIQLPAAITAIGLNSFANTGLTSITIPQGVTEIEMQAFTGSPLREIVFLGDAPVFFRNCFKGLATIAYYPADNATWTADVMQSYGGDITWLPSGGSHAHELTSVVYEPNCSDKGYTLYTCTVCGGSYQDDYVDALGHDFADATCTQPMTCRRENCGIQLGYALGHTWDGSVEGIVTCSVCGHSESHTHQYNPTVTEPGCDTQGYTTYSCYACKHSYQDDYVEPAGHNLGQATCDRPATCTRLNCGYTEGEPLGHTWDENDPATIKFCIVCGMENCGYRVFLNSSHTYMWGDTVWVDGKEYPVRGLYLSEYIVVEELKFSVLTTYQYNDPDAEDIHTQYPTSMSVFFLVPDQGSCFLRPMDEYKDILKYAGSSIRITGKKGIRMITSVPKALKGKLVSGLAGAELVEYGTVLAWAEDLEGGNPLVLGQPYAKSNYAYKRGVADPVYKQTANEVQYTNVLVGFTNDQCKNDIAMRSYMILENKDGTQYTIYGGIVYRSIGYIAYQNRAAFKPGTNAYAYVWDIIHHVYGDQYDADYKG